MRLTPDTLLDQLTKRPAAPAYLLLGPEPYGRDACRRVLAERVVPSGDFENGVSRHDLDEVTLAEVLDDARAFSLFASERLIWVARAEGAMPKGRTAAKDGGRDDDEDAPAKAAKGDAEAALAEYLKSPTPGVTIVFDASRYEFDGEDKAKAERVAKFYSAIPIVVEFARLAPMQVRALAVSRAKQVGLAIGKAELDLLVEITGASAMAVTQEIEKLSLHVGKRAVTVADIEALVPQGSTTTIFALVNALGRRDRASALGLLDTLVREGEYLPLALSFLATQFRQALVAQEAGLRTAGQVQGHFSKLGVAMWPSRAEQVVGTARVFPAAQLATGLKQLARTDRDLRDIRPDDRTVMEKLVLALTA